MSKLSNARIAFSTARRARQYPDPNIQGDIEVEDVAPTVIAKLPHEAQLIIEMLLAKLAKERSDREMREDELVQIA
jgi:hypothetical protein